jgi:Tfp pilus assembly protein PilO
MRASTKRILSAMLSLLFIFSAFVIVAMLIKPAYEETQKLKADALSRENALNNQKVLVDQFKKLLSQYDSQEKVQENLSLILPQNPAIGEALTQINGLLDLNHLNVLSFNINRPLLQSYSSSNINSTSTQVIKPLGTIDINFKVVGNYSDFKNFLNQLETNIRIFNIKTLNISPVIIVSGDKNQSQNKTLSYDISITTYYQADK